MSAKAVKIGMLPTAEQLALEEKRMTIVSEILAHDPSIGFVSALIIAGDQLSAQRAAELVASGVMQATKAVSFVGSYARLDFALLMKDEGSIPLSWLIKNLPTLWRDSDPDDTDPRFLKLWKDARRRRGSIVLDSRRDLPRTRLITVYRGQDRDAPLGIAWTADRDIAARYARGMALRQGTRNGKILTAQVPRRHVLAFLTKRNESEVIAEPYRHVTVVSVTNGAL